MWLAHALTLSRLPIAAGLVIAYGRVGWAVALVALAAATDAVDGTVARAMQQRGKTTPDIGGWLDPLVDKVFVVIVLATIYAHTRELGVIALIAARELLIAPLIAIYLVTGRPRDHLKARPIGKAATIAQFVACGIAIAVPAYALVPAAIAAVLGVVAVIDYVLLERERGASSEVTGAPSSPSSPSPR
ncbi:MAG: CDP-alcohol phosphatidyltransferase family protein [Myxococcales bacterium]|nr:CDP-alcohol phosphatidyltransferase family protein [Myxococcales bacterium]